MGCTHMLGSNISDEWDTVQSMKVHATLKRFLGKMAISSHLYSPYIKNRSGCELPPLAPFQQQEGMHCVQDCHMTYEGHCIITAELAYKSGITCTFP